MSYSLGYTQAILTVLFVADKVRLGMYDFVPTKTIAESLNIANPSAVKILQSLNRAGLIETREGAKGGVRLNTEPAKITLLDIFNAIEVDRPLFRSDFNINAHGSKPDRVQKVIPAILLSAETAMKQELATTTIEELMKKIN